MTQYNRCPVIIRGVYYQSISEASNKLDVSRSTINSALERGCMDSIGLGLPESYKVKITCDGITYGSMRELARIDSSINYISFANARIRARDRGLTELKYKGKIYTWSESEKEIQ